MPQFVLTLIAADPARTDTERVATAIATSLAAAGAQPGTPDWLAPRRACDIGFDRMTPAAAMQRARATLPPAAPFDLVAQPAVGRRKRLLVADLESTVIENEMLVEMADLIGIRDRVAAVTRRAMNGEIDFAESLRERAALFRDQPASLFLEAGRRIRVTPGAATLVRTMKEAGAKAILVSGGFRVFAAAMAQTLGFDAAEANALIVAQGKLTGAVREPILDAAAKRAALRRRAVEYGLDPAEVLAVGDGANDLPMLEAAGLGVAFHAKPHLHAHIRSRIDHADLSALLFIQGYRLGDFVAPG